MQWSVQEEAYSDWQMNVNILENSERIFLELVFVVPSHLPAHPSVRKAHIEEERHNIL